MTATPERDFPQPVTIKSRDGGLVQISPHGANILSWISGKGQDVLFLSPKAEYRAGTAIRGGVPVIFPQFAGLGKLTKHGFARLSEWEVARVEQDAVTFWLSETAASYTTWPHRFLAEYKVRVSPGLLDMTLIITNTDIERFSFTAALHTYLRVQDVRQAVIRGLQGVHYLDSTRAGQEMSEAAPSVNFDGEVDRTYIDAPKALELSDGSRRVLVRAEGFRDAVVWNPGAEKCAIMADMEPAGYRQFVCVEAAAAAAPVMLAPGEVWQGRQELSV